MENNQGVIAEKEIIDAILGGEKELFAELITRHNELLYRVGRSYINNHEQVEDLMQVTYLKAFSKLEQFNFNSSFTTWITRIMINECLMHVRKIKNLFVQPSDDLENLQIMDETTADSAINNEEINELCEKMLQKLPEEYRLIFLLREVQQLSTAEVAVMTGLTEDNVKVRLYRSKRMLQKLLLNYLGEPDIYSYHKKYCHKLTDNVMMTILKSKK